MPSDDEDTPPDVLAATLEAEQRPVIPLRVSDHPDPYVRAVAAMTRRNGDSIQAVRKRQDSDHRDVTMQINRVEGRMDRVETKVDNMSNSVADLRESVAGIDVKVDSLVTASTRAQESTDLARLEQVDIDSHKRKRLVQMLTLMTTVGGIVAGIITALAAR